MLTVGQLDTTIAEAERFLKAAKVLRKVLVEDHKCGVWMGPDRGLQPRKTPLASHSLVGGTRETGAVRRASMDLTRALADLRGYA